MPQLELNELEAKTLDETLTTVLSNMSYEIADTDTYDFRQDLKKKRDVLARIADKLRESS